MWESRGREREIVPCMGERLEWLLSGGLDELLFGCLASWWVLVAILVRDGGR